MNWRFTLIVFLVFVALLVFAFTQRQAPSVQVGEGAPTPTPLALLDVPPTDVQEVSVAGADGDYVLRRAAGGWEVDGQKASDEVDGLVERLARPTVMRDLPADRKPEDYGFATPTLTVTLKTAAGAEHVMQVGDDTVADYNVYVRLKDQPRIVIVGKSDIERLKEWLTAPPLAPTPTATGTPEGTPAAPAEGGTPGTGTPEAPADAATTDEATPSAEPSETPTSPPPTVRATPRAATATP